MLPPSAFAAGGTVIPIERTSGRDVRKLQDDAEVSLAALRRSIAKLPKRPDWDETIAELYEVVGQIESELSALDD